MNKKTEKMIEPVPGDLFVLKLLSDYNGPSYYNYYYRYVDDETEIRLTNVVSVYENEICIFLKNAHYNLPSEYQSSDALEGAVLLKSDGAMFITNINPIFQVKDWFSFVKLDI